MSAEYLVAWQGKRRHIGFGGEPICGESSCNAWASESEIGHLLGRHITQICSACVREADRIAVLAAGGDR